MIRKSTALAILMVLSATLLPGAPPAPGQSGTTWQKIFNVRDFGASGKKGEKAQAAIQKAVDACAAAGGGVVFLPPGAYTSGTIHLRSHVRFHIEAGAVLYSLHGDKGAFDKDALLYGEGLEGVTIEGRGTVDGEAAYDWRPAGDHRDDFIRPNRVEMEKLGLPLTRSFPRDGQYGKLVFLVRCRDVRITGLSFQSSPSWTMNLVACERIVLEGLDIRSSLKAGVWADGIDPDGCQDLRISNCTIETGDDALVFYSTDWLGPARPCENITVTNCRLSSSSSAIKFCDGNIGGVRNVTIDNCVITSSNRGIAFMTFEGGPVENVVLSNLTIDCVRNDWFWWGDGEPFHFNVRRKSEVHTSEPREKDRPAGLVRNIKIQNVIARGYGMSVCSGHPEAWLDGVSFENVKLTIAHDPRFRYDKAVSAIGFEYARNLRLRDFEVSWEKPLYEKWRSAVVFENVRDLVLDGLACRQAGDGAAAPAVLLRRVDGALIRGCRPAEGTGAFLEFSGPGVKNVRLDGNDARRAKMLFRLTDGASEKEIETGQGGTR